VLYSIDAGKYINDLPHKHEFIQWRVKVSDADYDLIENELNNRINGDEVHTAGWIPGSDWTGTVFEPLYFACGKNVEAAGLFFGLIVFKVIMDRKDCWGFGKYEKKGMPIRSMTYFKLNSIPVS
jgi:hypothetical protein